jgi:LuxR family maltose regulon positive regulatory protein
MTTPLLTTKLRVPQVRPASSTGRKKNLIARPRLIERLTLARIAIAQGRPGEAIAALTALQESAEAAGGMGYVIASLALQAVVLRAPGRLDQALLALERALSLAEPEGYVRTFVDEGEPMAALLRVAASRGIAFKYVTRLLTAFGEGESPAAVLDDPLSERELEVLRLLAAGLSNREIASELFLAVGTVKKHTSTIYAKLSVHSRTQATARARDLGLV